MRILIVILFLLASVQPVHAWQGLVARVVDGDTIHVITTGGTGEKIRLYGIDCPERNQPGGNAATAFVRSTIGRYVEIEEVARDRYGRLVALVHTGKGELLNQALVERGLAWVYLRYCKSPVCREWCTLEEIVKRDGIGLWSDSAPVAPWEWRRRK